jgi:tRNA threonylcarbamoyladenosine modification (KEOPS) complex Cgi121 subunit
MVLLRIYSEIEDIKKSFQIINDLIKNEIYQLIDPKYIVSERQIEIALDKAKNAFKQGKNKSKSLNNELLLWICAEKHVSQAIKKAGAKKTSDFFLFYKGNKKIENILEQIQAKKLKLEFTPDLKALKIDKKLLKTYKLEDLVLEKMAVSYLER